MISRFGRSVFLSFAFIGVAYSASLSVDPPASDDLFVQRNAPFWISGKADPASEVEVLFLNSKSRTIVDSEGNWKCEISAVKKTDGPVALTIKSKSEQVVLRNVLVGDIWFCSGQSNMAFFLKAIAPQEVPNANLPEVRFLNVKNTASSKPLYSNQAIWQKCTPETAPEFSATAFFFARYLQARCDVPIGVIISAWGGRRAQSFTRREVLISDPQLKPIVDSWDSEQLKYPEALEKYNAELQARKQNSEIETAARRPHAKLIRPIGPDDPQGPGNIWNGKILPYVGCPVTGFLWYQGESDASNPLRYRRLLSEMIKDWRQQWGLGDVPFFIVQLAGYAPHSTLQGKFEAQHPDMKAPPQESQWAQIREAQWLATKLPNVCLATAFDIGEKDNIHPKAKEELGRRLALLALNRVYGIPGEDQGSSFDSVNFDGDRAIIKFSHSKGMRSKDGGGVQGFAVAGDDKKYYWADAKVENESVVISSKAVPNPKSVRYGWADFPYANLYNEADLPAFPFRTDDWASSGAMQ